MFTETKGFRTWAEDLDQGTIDQAAKTTGLPVVTAPVALMPDAHLGYGAAIGSVVPTEGAIIPSAVGVDIGCIDGATEFMTPGGWKRIDQYQDGNKVLQFDPRTGGTGFVEPLAYIKKSQEWFYYLSHSKGLDQKLCPDHKMLLYKGHKKDQREYTTEISSDFFDSHEKLNKGRAVGFLTTFEYPGNRSSRLCFNNLEEVRLQIAVCADGSLYHSGDGVDMCRVHLRKERKIKRLKNLLQICGKEYKTYGMADGTVELVFEPTLATKSLSFLYTFDSKTLRQVVDELFMWDGHVAEDGQKTFFTSQESEAAVVQFVMAATGVRCGIQRVDYPDRENWKPTFQVYTTKNKFVNVAPTSTHPVEKVESEDGFAYCFTVEAGFLVLRRNGNIFTTGNCGVDAWETNITIEDLPDDLHGILSGIAEFVPAGVGQGHNRRSKRASDWLHTNPNANIKANTRLSATSRKQLGTLGSGNHFVELCHDETGRVWITLHSGSRGPGNQLAQMHIGRSKELAKLDEAMVDPNLAWFLEGTSEFQEYIEDLLWAQGFAYANRQIMMENVFAVVNSFIPYLDVTSTIACHHNYATRETYGGKEFWVTRKGAIRAGVGDMGVIPGSMGASSFVVRGLGNPDSYNSASHGAGRVMSRSRAKKTLTEKSLSDTMGSRVWLDGKSKALLDEHPDAYKDIHRVMELQSDLVEIEHELTSVLNFKGA